MVELATDVVKGDFGLDVGVGHRNEGAEQGTLLRVLHQVLQQAHMAEPTHHYQKLLYLRMPAAKRDRPHKLVKTNAARNFMSKELLDYMLRLRFRHLLLLARY